MKLREVRSFYIALYFNKKFEGNLSDARPSYMLLLQQVFWICDRLCVCICDHYIYQL